MKHSPFIVGDFNIKSVKEDDSEYYMVEGYASIYGNIDSYRDIVMHGAFAKDLLENGNERPILWQHKSDEPIGLGTFEERTEGLFVTIKMPKADSFVSERVMPQIKTGAVKGLSIGYWTVVEEYDREARVNRLKECKLRETSCVSFAANPLAQITAAKQFLGIEDNPTPTPKLFKTADISTPWDESEAIQSIKDNTGSTESPSRNYGIGFMKAGDGKSFDTYGLPYVKYIDNEFQIVPEAVYKAAGEVWKSNDPVLKDFVNQVYKKLGQEEPFKAGEFFIDARTLKNLKDLDVIFDDQTMLSTEAKQAVFKALRSPDEGGSVPEGEKSLLDVLKKANNDMKTIQEDIS